MAIKYLFFSPFSRIAAVNSMICQSMISSLRVFSRISWVLFTKLLPGVYFQGQFFVLKIVVKHMGFFRKRLTLSIELANSISSIDLRSRVTELASSERKRFIVESSFKLQVITNGTNLDNALQVPERLKLDRVQFAVSLYKTFKPVSPQIEHRAWQSHRRREVGMDVSVSSRCVVPSWRARSTHMSPQPDKVIRKGLRAVNGI